MQAIGTLAPENPDGQVERHVVRMIASYPDMSGAHFGLHGVRPVDDDHAARGVGRRGERVGRHRAALPVPERALDALEGLVHREVADNRHDRIVRHEVALVKRDDIVPRDGGDRFRRSRLRHAIGMQAVDQPVEHGVRDELRIFEADFHARQHLLPAALDFLRRERRAPREIGEHAQAEAQAVLHHDHVDEAEIGAGAGAHFAADEIDRVVELAGRLAARALREERRHDLRETVLAFRIERATRADDHPHADDRLLVMEDHHDLQPVGKRLEKIGREENVPRSQRTRRSFGRPARLRRRAGRAEREHERTRAQVPQRPTRRAGHRFPPAAAAFPDGISVMTSRFSGVKYVRATR